MFDVTHFLISQAWAQTAADTSVPAGAPGALEMVSPQFMLFFVIMAVFYFIVFRPQQKRLNEQEKMIKALRRGDRVITGSGIHGKITKLEGDDIVFLEIADGVNIKIQRAHIGALAAKTDPASTTANDGDDAEKKN